MFEDFDFSILDNPEFKEDAVREELIVPLIKFLEYKSSGSSRVVRSMPLQHMFVSIGSKRNKISIIPDYVFYDNDKPYWIMDAKAPWEEITKTSHVEQAYSYAIHPDVRAELFALCNGKEFALYSIRRHEPLLHFQLPEIEKHLEVLHRILNASDVKGDPKLIDYKPDYGLTMKFSSASDNFRFVGTSISTNFIGKRADNEYIMGAVIPGDIETQISFVFDSSRLAQLLELQTEDLRKGVEYALSNNPFYFKSDEIIHFGVSAILSDEISHNEEESWVDFIVDEFSQTLMSQMVNMMDELDN